MYELYNSESLYNVAPEKLASENHKVMLSAVYVCPLVTASHVLVIAVIVG
ncbi:hypothetical protein GW864_03680 [bacterium]|nr:hypothetical protein [bacterium]